MLDINNWKGKSAGLPLSNFDREQLIKGMKVEMEHTNDPRIAVRIAADHLTEDKDYYIKLEKIHLDEQKLRKIIREIALPIIKRKLNKQ